MNEGYSISVDAGSVIDMLGLTREELKPTILAELAEVSELTVETMKDKAPVGVGGDDGLRGSIRYELIPDMLASEIKPHVDYGDAVETGSAPHWAPIEPLKAWAELKGLNPYALRWSIHEKGTLPHPYVEPTYEEMAPVVGDKFAEGIAGLVGKANRGEL